MSVLSLPVEALEEIFEFVYLFQGSASLRSVIFVNKLFNAVAERILYRDLVLVDWEAAHCLFKTLHSRQQLSRHVRRLIVAPSLTIELHLLSSLSDEIKEVAQEMHNLTHLSVAFPHLFELILLNGSFRPIELQTTALTEGALQSLSQDRMQHLRHLAVAGGDATILEPPPGIQSICGSEMFIESLVPQSTVRSIRLIVRGNLDWDSLGSALSNAKTPIKHLAIEYLPPGAGVFWLMVVSRYVPEIRSLGLFIKRAFVESDFHLMRHVVLSLPKLELIRLGSMDMAVQWQEAIEQVFRPDVSRVHTLPKLPEELARTLEGYLPVWSAHCPTLRLVTVEWGHHDHVYFRLADGAWHRAQLDWTRNVKALYDLNAPDGSAQPISEIGGIHLGSRLPLEEGVEPDLGAAELGILTAQSRTYYLSRFSNFGTISQS